MSKPHIRDDGQEPERFRGLRVGVVGLGVEGQDAVRFLHAEGAAEIIVSDRRPPAELVEEQRALHGIPYRLEAGGNDPALAEQLNALFVSQGVPDDLPLLAAARARGLPSTAMMRLFLQRCPSPVIGITGSAGKSTTTSLVGEMFRAAGRPALVGGNIGAGLLVELARLTPATPVVLEISHTQLARTDRSPRLAAVLNVTPNHLDQFPWEEYVALKRNLVRHQRADDLVVLPVENATARSLGRDTPARAFYFGPTELPGPGATVEAGRIVWRDGERTRDIAPVGAVRLPGAHNLRNVLAAVAIAAAWGLPPAAMARAITDFRSLPHRLEGVLRLAGVDYVNDSIATAPERTMAALRAYDAPIVLLLGGREKRLPLDELALEAAVRTRAVICFGEAGALFAAAMRDGWHGREQAPRLQEAPDLPEAVARARAEARSGDVVLLSPAGVSFDAYRNFEERGAHFRALARELACKDPGRSEAAHGAR